jgi:Leucine-rich repeat (LRR) protein
MERLYLSLNRIREIPDEIGHCQRLVELDFSSNLLEAVPVGLAMCINLNLLNLGLLFLLPSLPPH